jgi:polar amino acid transport system substrate-binding protein
LFRHSFALIALLYYTLTSSAQAGPVEKVLVYGDDANLPMMYLENGKAKGILPDVFACISKNTGDKYELILVPWQRALQEAMHSKGGITNFSFTKERAIIYDFSEPIYNDDLHLVVLKGHEFNFKNIGDLKGKMVGGLAGASFGDKVDQAIANGVIVIDRDPHQLSRIRKLLRGRIDVAIINLAAFELLFTSNSELGADRSKFVVLPNPLVRDPLYLAFLKSMNMKPILARFNNALNSFKKTHTYKQIALGQENCK